MNLLYVTFGSNVNIHLQAAFSVCSFLSQKDSIASINIITDSPEHYTILESHVNIIKVTEAQLKDWQGEYNFFWRIKIKAIEMLCHLYPNEPILYLDTDTFLFTKIDLLKQQLQSGKALMHENEGALALKKSKTEKKMWQQVGSKKFGSCTILSTDCMWNAGVVAIPNTQNGTDCALALTICDDMCKANVTKRLIEQFALSVALEKCYGLIEARSSIAHYWSAKKIWDKEIADFFIKAYLHKWSFEQVVVKVMEMDKSKIPLAQKERNFNNRLKKIADKLFPNKIINYLNVP